MLSAVVIAHNEEENILDCLTSLSFCDEIVVVDDQSSDKTAFLAKKKGAKIVSHPLENDFARQRNFGLSLVKGDWVLFIDADERVDKRLREDIQKAVNQNTINGLYLKRRDYMWGKPLFHGENGHKELLRLAKKNTGEWSGRVHEVWNVSGPTRVLPHYLLHYPHQSVVAFLKEINDYTTIRAQELVRNGIRVHWWDMFLYPKAKFVQNYILRFGFMDGIRGLIVAIMMSLHSFLVRGKIWELQKQK